MFALDTEAVKFDPGMITFIPRSDLIHTVASAR